MAEDFDCVAERPRLSGLGGSPVAVPVWHVARSRGRTVDFVPIRCSSDEGIVSPGHVERRSPTCPDCVRIVASSGSPSTA